MIYLNKCAVKIKIMRHYNRPDYTDGLRYRSWATIFAPRCEHARKYLTLRRRRHDVLEVDEITILLIHKITFIIHIHRFERFDFCFKLPMQLACSLIVTID